MFYDADLGIGEGLKKYLFVMDSQGNFVFSFGTNVTKVFGVPYVSSIPTGGYPIIQLKEVCMEATVFELGEIDDSLEEIYGGFFNNGMIFICYQENANNPWMTSSSVTLSNKPSILREKYQQFLDKSTK